MKYSYANRLLILLWILGSIFLSHQAMAKYTKPGAPILVSTITRLSTNPTRASAVSYTVIFSAPVSNVTVSAFVLITTGITGAAISSVSGSGTTYTVTIITGSGTGSLRLRVTGLGINQALDNVPYDSGPIYDIDKTPPTGTITSGPPLLTNSTNATFTFSADEIATFDMSIDAGIFLPISNPLTIPNLSAGPHTVQIRAKDMAGNMDPVPKSYSWTIDNFPPSVISLAVPGSNEFYTGQNLDVYVNFNEPVIVNTISGIPSLPIGVGASTRQATYLSGSGTSSLWFRYVIQPGDLDVDGISIGDPLQTNGSIMTDQAGNAALLQFPGGLIINPVYVNRIIPTVAIFAPSTRANQPFTATIQFSEAVTGFTVNDIVVSNATLGILQTADNITYTVPVAPTADGVVILQVPAGVAINAVSVPNTVSNTLRVTYDATMPVVTSVAVPANAIYHTGEPLHFVVTFSEAVFVTGTPTLDIIIGGTTKQATYVASSANNLAFSYTVQNGDMDMNGISLTSLITGTIRDAAGNPAVLTLNNVASTSGVLVNTANPTVTISSSAASPVAQPFTATFTFSEAVTGFTASDLVATNATLSNFLTGDNITYTVLVTPTADGAVTIQVAAGVAVNVGNNPNTASNTLTVIYDGTAPTITSVDVPSAAVYNAGQVLSFAVHFSETVLATGTPTLDIVVGTTTRQATYISGSGTNSLLFSYTVQQGDMDMNGIALISPLTGTMQDAAGNPAVLTLNNIASTGGVLVNTANPTVTISTSATSPVTQPFTASIVFNEAVTGFTASDLVVSNATLGILQTADNITYTIAVTPAADGAVTIQVPASVAVNVGNNPNTASNTLRVTYDGTAPTITSVDVPTAAVYHAGQVLSFTVHFSETVLATGTPTLDIVIGTTTRQATYISGSGANSLLFSYTVQQGDMDMNGIALTSPLTGTLRDAAGNSAVLTLNNTASTSGVLVNTANPTVTISTSATSPVTQPFTASIVFNEAVTGFTASDLVVSNATLGILQTADNITYTIAVTPAADGALTIQVPAGVAVNVGNNLNTASNTLTVIYDGTAPTTTSVDVPSAAVYNAGQVLSFTVHFSENVLVTGTPTLDIVIGTITRQATYISGSGANSLLFSYTVQQGDMDMNGIALTSPLTGTLRDAAGNSAVLTLNNAGSTAGVLVNTAHPTVVISSNAAARVNTPVTVNVVFSEAVNGLTTTDITTTNALVSNLQSADQINYTLTLTPIADGAFNMTVPAGVAVNIGSNDNTASNTLAFTYDATAPVISVQTFPIGFDSPAGTPVGTLRATDASGVIQQWQITTDGSGGAFAIDANGTLTVKDATILSSKAGSTVSITVTVSDGLNTSSPATINMLISAPVVNQAPTLDAISDVMSCAGTDIHTIQLSGMSAGEPAQTYSLSVTADQSYFNVLTVDHSGILRYQLKSDVSNGVANVTVTIKDDGGTAYGGVDTRQQTFRITVNSLPIVTITSNKGNTVSKGDLVQLTATGGTSYNWEPADNIISGQNSAVLQVRVLTNNTYTVTVVNAAGCSNSSSINIATVADFKVEATNIMTPNGDGKNDKWIIRNLDSYPDNEVKIFDRTGRIVYQRKNYSNDWDGTRNGSPLAEGTYYYILTISGNTKTAKGYITLIRDQR